MLVVHKNHLKKSSLQLILRQTVFLTKRCLLWSQANLLVNVEFVKVGAEGHLRAMGVAGIRLKSFLPLMADGNVFDFTPKAAAFRRIQPAKDFRPAAFVWTELDEPQELRLSE